MHKIAHTLWLPVRPSNETAHMRDKMLKSQETLTEIIVYMFTEGWDR